MDIVINGRLLNERKGGPYRCLVNTLEQLAKIDNRNSYYILLNGKNNTPYEFFQKPNFIKQVVPIKNKLLFDYVVLPLYSFTHKRDIYYFPKTTFAPYIKGDKVSLFHDIIYFEDFNFREFKFFDNLHHKLMIPLCQRFAAACVSVSDFTAQRMQALLKIKRERITVIKNAAEDNFRILPDENFKRQTADKYNLHKPFLFFAGSISPRKNMLNVIKAFESIKETIPHNLYFTAGESWQDGDVYRYIEEKSLQERVIRLGFLSQEELVAVYNLAACYLYVSLYEGFGLPILEAQACGCPVITSTAASCPEVAGESALLADPNNTAQIADAIRQVVSNNALRSRLIQKGFANIKKFSWKKNAEEHLALFEKIYAAANHK